MEDVPSQASAEPRNRLVYVLLAFCLGNLGLHNFYAGYRRRALIQLIVSVAGCLLIFPPLLIAAWVAVEIVKVHRDACGVPFEERGWTGTAVLIVFSMAVVAALVMSAATLWLWFSVDM